MPRSRQLRLLQGTVYLLVCPSDLKRRSTTPVKEVFKALAICFLSEVGLPSVFIVGTELFVMVPGTIFLNCFPEGLWIIFAVFHKFHVITVLAFLSLFVTWFLKHL